MSRVQEKDLSDEWSDGSGAQDADGPVVATNPFSLIDKYGQTGVGVKPGPAANSVNNGVDRRGPTNAKKTAKRDCGPAEDSDGDSDESDDDVASSKTFSENDRCENLL